MKVGIRQPLIENLRRLYPSISQGECDFRAGVWSDIPGSQESFAYELGRALARDPPAKSSLPGLLLIDSDVSQMITQLVRYVE